VEKENPTVEKPSFSVPREKHLVFSTPAVEAQSLLPPRLFSFFHSFCILVLLFLKLTLFFLQREEKPTHNEREEETSMMKFSCEKALLQNAVGIASRTVAQKSSIPALEGLLLQTASALTISGYNMQTGIRTHVSADVTEQGEIVLNARLFGDIIRRMPDDVIVFSADDKQMVRLSCGDADFEILGLSAADYPELPEVEDTFSFSIQQKVLRDMIEQTAFAVSTNESRPVHTGALFEVSDQELAMVAVDGFRLAVRREALEKVEGGAFSFVAPGSALNEVEKICGESEDPARVTLGKRHVLFEVGGFRPDLPAAGGRISGLQKRHPPGRIPSPWWRTPNLSSRASTASAW
jgi:hypothetical protein